uniref:Immediate early response 3-interacting protein 1 n=1 Tax=Rattus norvegicus TaxID=10116 RepID=A0A8I6GEZ2_RAT
MAFTLYSLMQAALLCVNAIAVLHEERFLKNMYQGLESKNTKTKTRTRYGFCDLAIKSSRQPGPVASRCIGRQACMIWLGNRPGHWWIRRGARNQ